MPTKIQAQIDQLKTAAATSQTQIDALAKQQCSIAVHVFNDTNANGAQDKGETDTGARKVLLAPDNLTVTSDATSSLAYFNGLDAGTYTLTRPDFPAGYRLSNPTVAGGNTITVTLAAGEHKTLSLGTTNAKATSSSSSGSPASTSGSSSSSQVAAAPSPATPSLTRKWRKSIVDGAKYAATLLVVVGTAKVAWRDLAVNTWRCAGVREWISWAPGSQPDAAKINSIFAWCGKEVIPTLTFVCTGKPTAAQTTAYFQAVVAIIAGRACKAETGNEPNLAQYWSGTAVEFVTLIHNPAYAVLHAAGITVVSAGVTYSVEYVRQMIAAGMITDIIGFHPYRNTGPDLFTLLTALVAVIGKLPFQLTEFTIGRGPDIRSGDLLAVDALKLLDDEHDVLDQFPTLVEVACFVAYDVGTPNSPQALLTGDKAAPHVSVYGTQWGAL